jgi:hypothetical protein
VSAIRSVAERTASRARIDVGEVGLQARLEVLGHDRILPPGSPHRTDVPCRGAGGASRPATMDGCVQSTVPLTLLAAGCRGPRLVPGGGAGVHAAPVHRAGAAPPGASPLRLLHLSDLHVVARQRRKLEWVRRLADLEPDVVVSTGDNLAHPAAVPAVLEAHRELLDGRGWFVLGSNDYFAPQVKNPRATCCRTTMRARGQAGRRRVGRRLPTARARRRFHRGGWMDLTNRRGRLRVGGAVAGLRRGGRPPHAARSVSRRWPGRRTRRRR